MSFFQRSFLIRSSALIALTLGCSAPTIGCGGGDDDVIPPDDTGTDGDIDSSIDVGIDAGKDSGDVGTDVKTDTTDGGVDAPDTAKTDADAGTDTADTRPDAVDAADTADGGVDATDTATPDVGTDTTDVGTDTAVPDTSCGVAGSACAGGKICGATGVCGDCTTDAECTAATAGTLCFAGTCAAATCHPKSSTSCSGTDPVNCCAGGASAGACVSAGAGKTTCCDNTDCASLTGTTTCDTASNSCVCPAPAAGQLFVATTGSDTTGNGSSNCPFATVQKAVDTLVAAPPAVAASITLKKLAAGVATYATPATTGIVIPATIANGITVQSDGTAADVTVQGDTTASWVFNVQAAGASFNNLTIAPKKLGSGSASGGLLLNAASATAEGTITNVVITGLPTSGDGISIRSGTSPTVGPNVTITGGLHGVFVRDGSGTTASHPSIKSAAGAQTSISGTAAACVQVTNTTGGASPYITISSSDAATPVHLSNCSVGGIIVDNNPIAAGAASIDQVLIDKSALSASFVGIRLGNAAVGVFTNTKVVSVGGVGIQAEGNSVLQLISVASTGNSKGVYITGNASADVNLLTATGSTGSLTESDGLRCDSVGVLFGGGTTLKLRNSTFLSNLGSGVYISAPSGLAGAGCTADLGSATAGGNNVFNKTATKNTRVGLCYVSTSFPQANPWTSTWSCGAASGSGCSSSPAPISSATCAGTGDYSNRLSVVGTAGNLAIPLGQTCCGS